MSIYLSHGTPGSNCKPKCASVLGMKSNPSSGKILIDLKIIPQSQKNQLVDRDSQGRLKVKINAAPERGKANAELLEYLAKTLHISKSQIAIIQGETSRQKRIEIRGVKKSGVLAKLGFEE